MTGPQPRPDTSGIEVVEATLAELGPLDVHALYKLRVDVFVAEQDCPYAEIDEVDADPGTTHLLARSPDGAVIATLRVFGSDEPGAVKHIGRVCTARAWRGRRAAERLIRRGLDLCGDHPVEIGAQAYLEHWYARFGFTRCGPDYLDGRIPHLPMRRNLLG